jgi:dienelactone hydrolase
MKKSTTLLTFLLTGLSVSIMSMMEPENTTTRIKEEAVTYTADGKTFRCFVAFDENKNGKRPAILVIPEWWGLNEYARSRARQLAGLGYIAMAVDMYGDGKIAATPEEAQENTKPLQRSPTG